MYGFFFFLRGPKVEVRLLPLWYVFVDGFRENAKKWYPRQAT